MGEVHTGCGERGVELLEHALAGHEGLAGTALLRRATAVNYRAGFFLLFKLLFDCDNCAYAGGTQKIVSAAVAVAALLYRAFCPAACLLAKSA